MSLKKTDGPAQAHERYTLSYLELDKSTFFYFGLIHIKYGIYLNKNTNFHIFIFES